MFHIIVMMTVFSSVVIIVKGAVLQNSLPCCFSYIYFLFK